MHRSRTCDGQGAACDLGTEGYGSRLRRRASSTGLSTGGLEFGIRCTNAAGCLNGESVHSAWASLWGAIVTLREDTPPSVGDPTGSLWSDGWLRGSHGLSVAAGDAVGNPRDARARRRAGPLDGAAPVRLHAADPVHRRARCDSHARHGQLGDGARQLTVDAIDAAGNIGSRARFILVDNTAPAGSGVVLVPGVSWQSSTSFGVDWSAAKEASPIVRARVKVCPAGQSAGVRRERARHARADEAQRAARGRPGPLGRVRCPRRPGRQRGRLWHRAGWRDRGRHDATAEPPLELRADPAAGSVALAWRNPAKTQRRSPPPVTGSAAPTGLAAAPRRRAPGAADHGQRHAARHQADG